MAFTWEDQTPEQEIHEATDETGARIVVTGSGTSWGWAVYNAGRTKKVCGRTQGTLAEAKTAAAAALEA